MMLIFYWCSVYFFCFFFLFLFLLFFFCLMIRRPPRSTLDRSSAASDVYKRQPALWSCPSSRDPTRLPNAPRRESFQGGAADLGPRQPCQAIDPVSYTHLRAHETVLDLVCRLLLEKKKQRIPTDVNKHIQQ